MSFTTWLVKAMWLALQQDEPGDYVLAGGESHSVREFLELAFRRVGLNWKEHVIHDDRFERPHDVTHLPGNAGKASEVLGWRTEYSFKDIVNSMVDSDLKQLEARIGKQPVDSQPVCWRF